MKILTTKTLASIRHHRWTARGVLAERSYFVWPAVVPIAAGATADLPVMTKGFMVFKVFRRIVLSVYVARTAAGLSAPRTLWRKASFELNFS